MPVTRSDSAATVLPAGWRSIRARVGLVTTHFYISPEGRRFSSLREASCHISYTTMASNMLKMEVSRYCSLKFLEVTAGEYDYLVIKYLCQNYLFIFSVFLYVLNSFC
jgi:hypothetical protein